MALRKTTTSKLEQALALSASARSLFQDAYDGMDAAEALANEYNAELTLRINALVDEQSATLLAAQQAKDSKTQLAAFLPNL